MTRNFLGDFHRIQGEYPNPVVANKIPRADRYAFPYLGGITARVLDKYTRREPARSADFPD